MMLLAAVTLITVHMIDGRVVQVNPEAVTQLVHAKEAGNTELPKGVNCVIKFLDGTFVSVAETCDQVEDMIGGKPL